jgi:AcrR family transcriptional regulator
MHVHMHMHTLPVSEAAGKRSGRPARDARSCLPEPVSDENVGIEQSFNLLYRCSMVADDLKHKTAALRKRHVIDAAIKVFKRVGYREATIRSIAREAGVSDGTIYNVFENKEALLLAALHALLSDAGGPGEQPGTTGETQATSIEQLFLERWTGVDAEALAIVRIIWSEALRDPAFAARYLDVIMMPAMTGLSGVQPGFADGDTGMRTASRVVTAMFVGLVLLKALGDPVLQGDGNEAAALAANMLGRGLMTSGTGS